MRYDAKLVLREMFARRISRNSAAEMLSRTEAHCERPMDGPFPWPVHDYPPAGCGCHRSLLPNLTNAKREADCAIAIDGRRGGKNLSGI